MRYYAVHGDAENNWLVLGEFVDQDDATDFAKGMRTSVDVMTSEEMLADPNCSVAFSAWRGDPVEFDRIYALREWRLFRERPSFRIWVDDRAGDLRDYALPALPYADEDPTIELAAKAYEALSALAELLEAEREAVHVGASA